MSATIIRQGSKMDPEISCKESERMINISGWSFCENPVEVYEPARKVVMNMLNQSDSEPITISINLKCFNTASSKCLLELITLVDDHMPDKGIYNWHYDEEDPESMEWGEDLALVAGVPFNYIPTTE